MSEVPALAVPRPKISKHIKENEGPMWKAIRSPLPKAEEEEEEEQKEEEEEPETFSKRQRRTAKVVKGERPSYLQVPSGKRLNTSRRRASSAGALCTRIAIMRGIKWHTSSQIHLHFLSDVAWLLIQGKPHRSPKPSFLHNPSPQFWTCCGNFFF